MDGDYYHVYNKTIADDAIFTDDAIITHFLKTLQYYTVPNLQLSYSKFRSTLNTYIKDAIKDALVLKQDLRVNIFAYCIMPNHYHVLLKEKEKGDISQYMNDVLNSFTRYYNIRFERKGPVFLPNFKRKQITSEKTFLHVMRYIHLNMYSAGLIDDITLLNGLQNCSHSEYVGGSSIAFIDQSEVMNLFDNDVEKYKEFIFEQAGYQKSLQKLKYL